MNEIFLIWQEVGLNLLFVWQKVRPQCGRLFLSKNKDNIIETLEEYIGNLQQFKTLMEEHKFDKVFEEMQQTNHIASIFKRNKIND